MVCDLGEHRRRGGHLRRRHPHARHRRGPQRGLHQGRLADARGAVDQHACADSATISEVRAC